MSYATLTDMIEAFGRTEMARLCDRDDEQQLITADPELFEKAVAGEDLSGYSPEEQDAAEDALARGHAAMADGAAEMDSRIACRYALPLSAQVIEDNGLQRKNCDISRYLLADDHAIDEVRKRYEGVIEWLKAVATGKACLVGADPVASDSPEIKGIGQVRHGQAASSFDWGAYS